MAAFRYLKKPISYDQFSKVMTEAVEQHLKSAQASIVLRCGYHDMSKHLRVLQGMTIQDGHAAASEYLNDMLKEAAEVSPQIHTGNAVLDTLLMQKEAECREKEIILECMVDFSKADFIRYADIVTLFFQYAR